MSETTAINPIGAGSSADEKSAGKKSADNKKKAAAFATAAATAAGAGVAVSSMLSDGEEVVEEVVEVPVTDEAEESVQQETVEPEAVVTEEIVAEAAPAVSEVNETVTAPTASHAAPSHHTAPAAEPVTEVEAELDVEVDAEAETVTEMISEEPVEISTADITEAGVEAVTEEISEVTAEPEPVIVTELETESVVITEELPEGTIESVVDVITDELPEATIETVSEEEETSELTFEEVAQALEGDTAADIQPNANELAEAVIAEEQVDPTDIDVDNVINFQEVGTMYTADGASHAAASFQDASGHNLVMVDVDDDGVFDVFADNSGNILAPVTGRVTVDDAEMHVADDGGYLAYNDTQITDDFGADSIEQDMLT
ncbi:MAG: hypothetical protein K2H47_12030 [Muribaculaceae bacterium]|nr:hypothetical protein [Muribaculaceae bacterium]